MRQTKFRALDAQGVWRIGNLITDGEKGIAITQQKQNPIHKGNATGWCFPIKEGTEGEYTGRDDAEINGKEVYEGDIIKNYDKEALQVVYWNEHEAAWYCRYIVGDDIVSLADSLGNLNEVIGNIHEQPELLK